MNLAAPSSPCIDVCRMNSGTGLCEGCLRTITEIAAWGGASPEEKQRIWQAIQRRRAAAALKAPPPAGPR